MSKEKYNHSLLGKQDIEFFVRLLGDKGYSVDSDTLLKYGSDETEDISSPPGIVLFPKSTNEVVAIMTYCYERNLPITPRGAGT